MKLRKVLRKVGLSALALGVFLLGAELVARWAEPGPMSLWDSEPYLPDAGLGHVHEPGFQGRWDSTWYGINSQGWRGPEVQPTFAPEEFRVLCLGDSCTFGKGVVEAATWPRQLEGLLREHMGPGRRPLVFNLGVNGYSMWQYQRVLEQQARQLKPHLVLVGYNVNDYDSAANKADGLVFSGAGMETPRRAPGPGAAPPQPPGDGAEHDGGAPSTDPTGSQGRAPAARQEPAQDPTRPAQSPPTVAASSEAAPAAAEGVPARKDSLRKGLRRLLPKSLRDDLNRLAFYRFLRASYYDWSRERDYRKMAAIVNDLARRGPATQEQAFAEESALLDHLVQTANQSGAQVAIFLFPFEAMVYAEDFDRGTERFVERLADEAGVAFFDVPQAFRARLDAEGRERRLFVRGDRYHPNPAGYGIVAEAVFAGLRDLGWLDNGQ